MTFKVAHLTADDLAWPDRGNPSISTPTGAWPRKTVVHARPMYRHDPALVEEVLRHCEGFAIHESVPQHLTTTDREFESGFNGYAFRDYAYYDLPKTMAGDRDGNPHEYSALCTSILLGGKPVPPHPRWTRYLVGHEYGHCAWYAAEYFLGYIDRGDKTGERDYMRMRGHDDWKDGKMWHQLAIEIIANDFRVAVARVEPEFWQHDVAHPDRVPAVRAWWEAVAPRVAGAVFPPIVEKQEAA